MRDRAVSWTLAGLTALVLAMALTLLGLDASRITAGKLGFEVVVALATVLYAGTGYLIMVRRPGNAIGALPRYNADLMIAVFAARLADATDLHEVQSDPATTVDQALAPSYMSLWLSR
jgi:hypothetical protein